MKNKIILNYINKVLENMPKNWLNLTTHRLDIYDEKLAKTQFLKQFEVLFNAKNSEALSLDELPTAYDYIRLGHPLSCLVEWVIAHLNNTNPNNVISFSSKTASILSILRKNLFANKNTQIIYTGKLPDFFDAELLRRIYGYKFDLLKVENTSAISKFNGSTIFISQKEDIFNFDLRSTIDFSINIHTLLGSILVVNGEHNESYISDIQHVRRRETIAMTPANSLAALKFLIEPSSFDATKNKKETSKTLVLDSIKAITGTNTKALVGSSGLSIQYAILMGLIHDALENHKGKAIKIVVPPNCYGGTNDQARRVAACIKNVEILDLPVDGEHDMVESIDLVLNKIANENGIPFIIAEIPTNPRVEVPNLKKLRDVLTEVRKSITGDIAIDPIFILDQTFCPNVHFLGEGEILSTVRTISFASGSKFPSGGKCTAGYCIGNTKTNTLMEKIELHLTLCDNEATALQYKILAKQMPSMNQRIKDAYINTRKFVNFISDKLPEARINFVSEALAKKRIYAFCIFIRFTYQRKY